MLLTGKTEVLAPKPVSLPLCPVFFKWLVKIFKFQVHRDVRGYG
jgi:hypothetical protein